MSTKSTHHCDRIYIGQFYSDPEIRHYSSRRRIDQAFNRYMRMTGFGHIKIDVDRNLKLERIRARRELRQLIRDCDLGNGTMYVYEWGRDCDMCEGDSVTIIPATLQAFDEYAQNVYDAAEGPTTVYPVPRHEGESFVSSRRDLALEAFEDGHSHVVYGGGPRL